ncbi:MAG: alpha/beta hydrolase [Lachnospiraceae bacterium]|nr:alpha/beta hydrolase [Lachnospiraceae bacterium]
MRRKIEVKVEKPQYSVITGITFAQVDNWFGHTRKDLKMDIIYPEDPTKEYPCILWICGGAWRTMDRSAHLAYLSGLAMEGFVVASAEYRTTNEVCYPMPLQDVKAGIRYLKAHAGRYHIDKSRVGVMGESAGGHLAAMAALCNAPAYDVGAFLEDTSTVQAAVTWYPPADVTKIEYPTEEMAAVSMESLLLGKNTMTYREEAEKMCPVYYVTREAPPFLIIHGDKDHTVPFSQGEALYEKLEQEGCDVTLLEIKDADHADIRFFQKEVWQCILCFFKDKLVR